MTPEQRSVAAEKVVGQRKVVETLKTMEGAKAPPCSEADCDTIDKIIPFLHKLEDHLHTVAVQAEAVRSETAEFLSNVRQTVQSDLPDDVAEVVTDRVGEALEHVDEVYRYECHGVTGEVCFVDKEAFGVKSRDVVATVKDDLFGCYGLCHEETFNSAEFESENWQYAVGWTHKYVDSLAVASLWRRRKVNDLTRMCHERVST